MGDTTNQGKRCANEEPSKQFADAADEFSAWRIQIRKWKTDGQTDGVGICLDGCRWHVERNANMGADLPALRLICRVGYLGERAKRLASRITGRASAPPEWPDLRRAAFISLIARCG